MRLSWLTFKTALKSSNGRCSRSEKYELNIYFYRGKGGHILKWLKLVFTLKHSP